MTFNHLILLLFPTTMTTFPTVATIAPATDACQARAPVARAV